VFDALTSERPYKKAWSINQATNLIRERSGQHFEPVLL
jgi:putative two-component system response regulator